MKVYDPLVENIEKYVPLDSEEKASLLNILRLKKVRKKELIIRPGKVCRYRSYILQGAFKVYYLDEVGKEHTVSIGVEDWFVTDFYSYINQEPAMNYAEAIEDSVIVQMKYEDIENLCKSCHAISEYFRLTTEKAFAYSRRRVIANISMSAQERYEDYFDKYPHIVNRVPQYILASYLGITPEFLSKIRSRKKI